MKAEDKHRYLIYGRTLVGAVCFAVFVILGISAAFTHTLSDKMFLLGSPLLLSIIVLPRETLPRGKEVVLGSQQRARFEAMRRWLVWFRLAIFITSAVIFLLLPEVV